MDREKLQYSMLRGLSSLIFTGWVVYLGSRAWISLTISVGPVKELHSVVNAATVLAAASAFFMTTLASYTTQKSDRVEK